MTDEEKESLESYSDAISQLSCISKLVSDNEEVEETNEKEKKRGRPPLNNHPKKKYQKREGYLLNRKQNQRSPEIQKDAPEAENPNHPRRALQDAPG